MCKIAIKSLCISVMLMVFLNGSSGQKDYFTAAVFEIAQYQNSSLPISEIVKKNFILYAKAGQIAWYYDMDIMVYPEEGLFPNIKSGEDLKDVAENIPDPTTEKTIPCNEEFRYRNSPILRNLSCLAQDYNFYLVAGVIDMKKCNIWFWCNEYNDYYCRRHIRDCPQGGMFFYNTLVAFDRQGMLIARYYKRHLDFEKGISTPKIPKNVYLETNFSTITGDIGFDLFFGDAVEGAERPDVTALSYPTWWHDHTPPMYFATPYQQAWSMTNKINVLAANVHNPRDGSLGSGIYSPVKGALIYTNNPDGESKMLISKVPISTTEVPKDFESDDILYYVEETLTAELVAEEDRDFKSECGFNVLGNASDSLTDYRCHQTEVKQFTFIQLNETKGNISICSNKFCCSLNYEAKSMDETFYFGVSGNPLNFQDAYLFGNQACFLARCEPFNGEPCRNFLLKSKTIFTFVEIKGSFDTKYVYPYAINSNIRLTDKEQWDFDGTSKITYQNSKKHKLLFIGLNGRLYDEDKMLNKNDAILTRKISLSVFMLPFLCFISLKLQEQFW